MQPQVSTLACGQRVLRIEIDRPVFCPEFSNALHDDVYAILLTPSVSTAGLIQPAPLSDTLTRYILDEILAALIELRFVDGHDKMTIASAISWARTAAPITLASDSRMSMGTDEADRLARAANLQAVLRPALDRIDRKLARYGAFVRARGLETAVVRLGLQSDLGATLRLQPSTGGLQPSLRRRHRRGKFKALWQSSQNALAAFEDCLNRIHQGSAEDSNWLEHVLAPLQSGLMNCIIPPFSSGQYRGTNLRIRSVFGSALHELAIPSDTIPEAMAAFMRGFDGRLWGDIHPLVRAGMAHIELMAIHPFRDGNGRLGRLPGAC
jgi:hypothetical protein